MFSGKKTYAVSVLFLAYAGLGFFIGEIDGAEAAKLVLEGGGFAALRAGVAQRIGLS